MNLLAWTGRAAIDAAQATGALILFAIEALLGVFRPPLYLRQFGRALYEIGWQSLPVVALTAVFTGMVLALQSFTGFSRVSAEATIPSIVALSITRELGPVLAGLMVAGRAGAAMAAEIGTMRVTNQIDALTTLSTPPRRYLVTPRLFAAAIALPLLVAVADVLGVAGGYLIATLKLGFSGELFLRRTIDALHDDDVATGLAKAAAFGLIIALMGTFRGFNSRGGAEGVGAATTGAVVSASVLILASDYLLTEWFFAR